MHNFIIIAVFLVLGVVVKRYFTIAPQTPIVINQLIVNVVLPAVIVLQLPTLRLDRTVLLPAFAPWLFFALSVGVVHFIARFWHWPDDVKGALYLLVPMGNTSYLGYPMAQAFFGSGGMPYAIVFDQIGNFLLLAIAAPVVIARYGSRGKPSVAGVVRRVFSFPPFIALCLALGLLRGHDLAGWLVTPLTLLAMTMAPLAMFVVGLQLSWRIDYAMRRPLAVSLAMKLLVSPLFVLLLAVVLGVGGMAARVSVFEAGMPPMVTAGIMAMAAGLAPRLCAAAVGFGLCLSLVTLPLWHVALQWLLS